MGSEMKFELGNTMNSISVWTAEKYLNIIFVYLHLQKHLRVIYLLAMVIAVSLYGVGRDFLQIEIFTGKDSPFNQVFVKMGWAWTLSVFLFLRICCLTLRPNYLQHLWRLLVRASVTTLFFYLWCQIVFPTVEDNTGYCVKQGIIMDSDISKKRCLRKNNHEYYSFDISGHSFLLSYCIFVLMEESMELLYVFDLGKFLSAKGDNDGKEENKMKAKFNANETDYANKRYNFMFPIIIAATLFVFSLCILWDFMLIITTIYYHTFVEKIIGTFLAVFTWYLLYPVIFTKYNLL